MRPARERALAAFAAAYGREATHLAWGPGRVNLIGEHTDYNDGFVLPMALERRAYLAFAPRHDGAVRLVAADLGAEGAFTLAEVAPGTPPRAAAPGAGQASWLDYPKGVAWALAHDLGAGALAGFDGALASDVPRGAGLSSSAAVELAVAAALLRPHEAGPEGWDVRAVARAAQRAENAWVGVATGIMDQLVGAAAVAGCALLIDCRDLSFEPVPLPDDVAVAVLDTGTRRGLVGSAYDDRRAACERVAAALGAPALRDVTIADLRASAHRLDATDLRRSEHVVAEITRALAAADALEAGDAAACGRLMDESHASLRDLFEVSSPALDAIVAAARAAPGCLGARMTGAGFGGCAVALVEAAAVDGFATATRDGYERATGTAATVYVSAAGPGAGATAL